VTLAVRTTLASPFLGLRYFDENDSHLYFGRDVQINDVLEKLRRSRFVMVMGSSGSGKSSLVRAGVIPRLKAGLLGEAGPRWRIAKMRPGSNPITSLTRELEQALGVPDLDVTLRRGPLGLVQAVEECRLPRNENVLVVADQFEELFRYQREAARPDIAKEEAAAFVKLLLEATVQSAVPIFVIVTMRSDYLGNCAQFRDLPERINDGLYLVPRMRRDQLEQAITGPIAVEDAEIAPRLLQKLLNETGDDADQLPVLQHALQRTWNVWHGAPRPLDLEDLEATGGMKDGLSRHADELFAELSTDQQRIARIVFQQLTERDAEGREIRRPAPVSAIAAVAGTSADVVERVAARFAAPEAALLYRNTEGHLDITHESLIRKWSRIQGHRPPGAQTNGWMQEEVDARDQYQLLLERAAKKDTLVGGALDDALRWQGLGLNAAWAARYRKSGAVDAFDDVMRFIEESRTRAVRRQRARRSMIIGVITALVLVLVVIFAFWRSANDSARQARAALTRLSTQEASRLVAGNEPALGLANLARALRSTPDDLAARSWVSHLVSAERVWMPGAPLRHERPVVMAVFSPDGRLVLTASSDNVAQLWDAATSARSGEPLRHTGIVQSAAFSRDGRRVVTASADGTAQVWDVATGGALGAALRPGAPVVAAAFSPDGGRVLTAAAGALSVWDTATGTNLAVLRHNGRIASFDVSPDGRLVVTAAGVTAQVWNVATGQPGVHVEYKAQVRSAVFSPDGARIATASSDGTARVWDVLTGKPVTEPLAHRDAVLSARFSPDATRLVTASADYTAGLWDIATGRSVRFLPHERFVRSAVFSPDGSSVVTASEDNTARVWDTATGMPIAAPLRHQGIVLSATFSADGRRIVTASGDNTARVWESAAAERSPVTVHQSGGLSSVRFSPDGRRMLTAGPDETALWDATTGRPLRERFAGQLSGGPQAFSPDGRRIVSFSSGAVQLWDAGTGSPGDRLSRPSGIVVALFGANGGVVIVSQDTTVTAWDPTTGRTTETKLQSKDAVAAAIVSTDGRRIATYRPSSNARAQVWDAVTGAAVGPPLGAGMIDSVAFSPDGRRVVTTSVETARVWDVETSRMLPGSIRHQAPITSATFSADGSRILTASSDTTAQLWDAATGRAIGASLKHAEAVNSAAFSPDGRRIVTASEDATAQVWDASSGLAIGPPLRYDVSIRDAAFSPDGHRVVTAAEDGTARVWTVLVGSSSPADAEPLADLAEVVGGYRLTDAGAAVPLEAAERIERLRRLAGSSAAGFVPLDVLLKGFQPAAR
jgi:WD40 repeat protein